MDLYLGVAKNVVPRYAKYVVARSESEAATLLARNDGRFAPTNLLLTKVTQTYMQQHKEFAFSGLEPGILIEGSNSNHRMWSTYDFGDVK